MDQNLATKSDLMTLNSDIKETVITIRSEIKEIEGTLRSEMKELEYKIVIRLGTLMTALTGIAVAILKAH